MVNQPIEVKEEITDCGDGYHRCCYLLSNGKRCKNHAVGLRKIDGKLSYALQCKQHVRECDRKYEEYKSVCQRIFESKSNLKNLDVCGSRFQKNVAQRISNIQDCVAKRVLWPKRCTYGCIAEPCSEKAKKMTLTHDRRHEHVIRKLIKCKKNLTHR